MINPDTPENPDQRPGGPAAPGGPQYHQVGYDNLGNPVFDDGSGNLFTFRSPDGTYQPYSGPVSQEQHPVVQPPPPQPTAPTTPPPPGGGGTGAPPSSQFPPFNEPWNPPANTPLPGAPEFTAPGYTPPPAFSFADFTPTDASQVLADKGFQFRTSQGRDILEHGAAAKGILNTGMSLKDILDYGQNAASQEFQNVDTRRRGDYTMNRGNAVDTYNTNYKTQYYDPYQIAYKGAYDAFGGKMDAWKTNAGFTERANEFGANAYRNHWWDDYQVFLNEQRDRWGRAKDVLTA